MTIFDPSDPQITQDTRPTIVDAPLTLIFRMWSGAYVYTFWLLMRPIHSKWTVTYLWRYFTINSSISECDHKCETQNVEPEIGTNGSSLTRLNPRVDGYGSRFGPPRVSGSGFWTGLEPNRPVFAVQTRSANRLPGPVATTRYGESIPFLQGCKGTYACVRLYRHTHDNYSYTVPNVDSSDSKWRCIGKIITRDLSLLASRLYRMVVSRPQSRVAVKLSLSSGADLLGCINRTREKERKGKQRMKQSHQQKIIPSGRNGSVRVDVARQSRQRHLVGGILRAGRQYQASC